MPTVIVDSLIPIIGTVCISILGIVIYLVATRKDEDEKIK